jgi:hypothetical protein
MRYPFGLTLTAVALTVAAVPVLCAAQARLSYEQSGLGLKQQTGVAAVAPFGGEAAQLWQTLNPSDFALYGGARELARIGLGPGETYGGVTYAFPRGWGSSLEAGYTPESQFAPRRYALTGQVQTALSDRKALSVGIQYSVYDTDVGTRGDASLTNGYTLTPSRTPGAGFAPGYQLQFGYQHSAFSSFGFALGREMETYSSAFDPTGAYPRQVSFTGQHWLTPSWALSYDLLSGDLASPSPLRLQGLGLRFGVRYRF